MIRASVIVLPVLTRSREAQDRPDRFPNTTTWLLSDSVVASPGLLRGTHLSRTFAPQPTSVQWARQGPFRLVGQALLIAAHNDDPREDEERG